MTNQFDVVAAIMARDPQPGEPSAYQERLDWAISVVTARAVRSPNSSLVAEAGSDAEYEALITISETRGTTRTMVYHPTHPGAFEDERA